MAEEGQMLNFVDFDLDFLDPTPTSSTQNSTKQPVEYADQFQKPSVLKASQLAKKISECDSLVRKQQEHLANFQQSAREIRQLYEAERDQRKSLQIEVDKLRKLCQEQDGELLTRNLQTDQLRAKVDEAKGPLAYIELAAKYVKLAQKLDLEKELNWRERSVATDLAKYLEKKGKALEIISSAKKRGRLRKEERAIQCSLLEDSPEKQVYTRSTQCESIRVISQGTQHIPTTTTRSTSTSCFIKQHNVGTCFPEPTQPPQLSEMLNTIIKFHDTSRLSPISDLDHETSPPRSEIDQEPEPQSIIYKSVGTCTFLCNIQRRIDFLSARPMDFTYDDVKHEESSTPLPSPPPTTSGQEAITAKLEGHIPSGLITIRELAEMPPDMFLRTWQMAGQMFMGLLYTPNAKGSYNSSNTSNKSIEQEQFHKWLYSLYESVQEVSQNRLVNTEEDEYQRGRIPSPINVLPASFIHPETQRNDANIKDVGNNQVQTNFTVNETNESILEPAKDALQLPSEHRPSAQKISQKLKLRSVYHRRRKALNSRKKYLNYRTHRKSQLCCRICKKGLAMSTNFKNLKFIEHKSAIETCTPTNSTETNFKNKNDETAVEFCLQLYDMAMLNENRKHSDENICITKFNVDNDRSTCDKKEFCKTKVWDSINTTKAENEVKTFDCNENRGYLISPEQNNFSNVSKIEYDCDKIKKPYNASLDFDWDDFETSDSDEESDSQLIIDECEIEASTEDCSTSGPAVSKRQELKRKLSFEFDSSNSFQPTRAKKTNFLSDYKSNFESLIKEQCTNVRNTHSELNLLEQNKNNAPKEESTKDIELLKVQAYLSNGESLTYLNSIPEENASKNFIDIGTVNSAIDISQIEMCSEKTISKSEVANHCESIVLNYSPASPPPSYECFQSDTCATKCIPLQLKPAYQGRNIIKDIVNSYSAEDCQMVTGNITKLQKQQNAKIESQIKVFLENYLTTTNDANINIKVSNVANNLQILTKNCERIATVIVEQIKNAPRPQHELECSLNNVPAKYVPSKLRLIVVLLQRFQNSRSCCVSAVLSKIENVLFHYQNKLYSIDILMNLLQLYLLSIPIHFVNGRKNPARLLLAKILYYHITRATPLVYEVLSHFPNALPRREDRSYDRSDVLITVIQHRLMCTKYVMEKEELRTKELLSMLRFYYHFEPFKPTAAEVLENLMEKLKAGKLINLKYAFAIFCKRQPQAIIKNLLEVQLIPLLKEYEKVLLCTSEYDKRIATLLDVISTIIKPLSIETTVTKYIALFHMLLIAVDRPVIQDAAIMAILRMQRFGYLQCFHALSNFKTNSALKYHTKQALQSFIHRKPRQIWTYLLNDKHATKIQFKSFKKKPK